MNATKQSRRTASPLCRLSAIGRMHYGKLILRSALFLLALILYILARAGAIGGSETLGIAPWALILIWVCYMTDMVTRLFPSRLESMGCQRQFRKNYMPTGEPLRRPSTWKSTFAIVAAWIALNGVIGGLYHAHVIDAGILFLVGLAYGICDMICILFFCPFQTWFMKNRCCATCRIYNWDFAMMFTPCLFLPMGYTWSLLGVALIILARWELTLRLYPERFFEQSNACVSCKHCKEKLCRYKPQLRRFARRNRMKIDHSEK